MTTTTTSGNRVSRDEDVGRGRGQKEEKRRKKMACGEERRGLELGGDKKDEA